MLLERLRLAKRNVLLWLAVLFLIGILLLVVSEWKSDILLPVARNLMQGVGATLITATVIGFVLESLGWKRIFEDSLLNMLTNPQAVRGMHLTARGIKDKIRGLTRALYPKADMPSQFYDAVERNIIDKLLHPVREDCHVTVELREQKIRDKDIVVMTMITRFVAKNYSGENQPLFREDGLVCSRWIDVPWVLQSVEVRPDELYKFQKLKIAGDEKDVGCTAQIRDKRVTSKVEFKWDMIPQSEDDYCPTEVSYVENLTFDQNDVYFVQIGWMTLDFYLDLKYSPSELEAFIVPNLPPYEPYNEIKEESWTTGHKYVNIRNLLFPGYSVAIYWRKR